MKSLIYIKLTVLALLYATSLTGQTADGIYYIKSSRSAAPLIEKWISEYAKVNPEIRFQLADKNVKIENISLSLVSDKTNTSGSNVSYFGKYALLPIANEGNPILADLTKKRLNEKRLKELFFEKDLSEEDYEESKPRYQATVYSGNNEVSFAQSFASHFGYATSSFKGKKISGDDVFLVNAIQKDDSGVSYNVLGNIFDLGSRKLKSDVVILPLDIKKEYREFFSASTDIDRVLNLLETESIDLIPTESVGFTYASQDKVVKDFLLWVLTEGKSYNHNYGVLNIDQDVLTAQVDKIKDALGTHLAQNK